MSQVSYMDTDIRSLLTVKSSQTSVNKECWFSASTRRIALHLSSSSVTQKPLAMSVSALIKLVLTAVLLLPGGKS